MAQFIRPKTNRANNKKGKSVKKAADLANAFLRNVLAGDARLERAEEKRQQDKAVNCDRPHHSGNGRITVFRRE